MLTSDRVVTKLSIPDVLSIERTPGTEDLVSEVLTKDKVMTLYEYSAFGIACAIMPSTNPVATVINNVIGLLASGNAVILCPHQGQ